MLVGVNGKSESLADVVERLGSVADRLERSLPLSRIDDRPALTPQERQEQEIRGARVCARNWLEALDRNELVEALEETYANNAEALAAALDEIGDDRTPQSVQERGSG
jgi:hypothetical protein